MQILEQDYLTARTAFAATGAYLTPDTETDCAYEAVTELLAEAFVRAPGEAAYRSVAFREQWPHALASRLRAEFGAGATEDPEAYAIVSEEDRIEVYAATGRGLLYGAATLVRLSKEGFVPHGLLYNRPVCPVRGLKLYLPTRDGIAYFKRFVDMLCRFQYNTVMLEVGGAMAYERHPEINEGWVRYCAEMREYSGKTIRIQEQTFPWYKNSMHVENGGGSFLTQDEARELVQYCKARFLDVIPEVPSLSHCDYLLINHPEIAERKNDPYPDTYCPSDERSYALLFDVLDEVLDVFEPETVHVGHDEYYSIGLCERCKGKPAEKLYADDLSRIHGYLAEKGVKTMIWCEKLIDAMDTSGKPWGGAERPMVSHETGVPFGETIPPTFKAIGMVPKDVHMLHWYWQIDAAYDRLFLDRGMRLVYGNFDGPSFLNWKERREAGAQGGIISNWSETAEGNLQRNGILFSMAYSAFMFWREDYAEGDYADVADASFEALFRDRYRSLKRLASDAGADSGTAYVEIVHATDDFWPYRRFFDGIFLEVNEYRIGAYTLVYADGTEAEAPICYGTNISGLDRSWDRAVPNDDPLSKDGYRADDSLLEAAYTTRPTRTPAGTYYRWILENPFPGKTVARVRLTVDDPSAANIFVQEIQPYPTSSACTAGRAARKPLVRILGEGGIV
ncbi:hexosaminidase [Cohnella sp. OV330]|uniref:family 20 glycosylhydrolase n=1 Tax=Cohnella sp. OV330 TaxID=1855288 RepID=UPI0008F2B45F|nr:family 20 glycosylhydrolase [Cohnella sp. OV330]SFB39299.1 hexosaminidase [Cohnella sp. OV330]